MFSVGEHVIHPGQGVCTVMGFTEDAPSPMIILASKSGHSGTHLMYPQSQQSRLHSVISAQDARALMDAYDTLEVDNYTDRNSSLEEAYFKQQVKLGAPTTVRIVKTMHTRIDAAHAAGKKPCSYYTRVLKEARRRAVEELSAALGMPEETVQSTYPML